MKELTEDEQNELLLAEILDHVPSEWHALWRAVDKALGEEDWSCDVTDTEWYIGLTDASFSTWSETFPEALTHRGTHESLLNTNGHWEASTEFYASDKYRALLEVAEHFAAPRFETLTVYTSQADFFAALESKLDEGED